MGIHKILTACRWFFFREGFLYILVVLFVLMCVDITGVEQSVKIRKLNDIVTGINTSQLYAFSEGKIPASAIDWPKLTAYFRMILEFFPSQEDAEMFLGYCEYYGMGDEESALEHIHRSADNMPYYFWNDYDTGLLLFKEGDYDHAITYFEISLLAPADKMVFAIGNSIIYRQFFLKALNVNIEDRLNNARQNAVLLLAASFYYKKNYDMAELFATKGISTPGITNREPFYFYEGAITLARGKSKEALSYFEQAIKAKSRNPMVYRYAAEILKNNGRLKEAQSIDPNQFPYPGILKLEFY